MELEQYRTSLEQMVEEKSKDLIAIQENLEATNRRQALFIKVLQILQLEPDIPTAMNMALAEIGRYTGVDRLATWENHLDGVTYGCTNEWCNDGIEPAIDYLRSMTIEAGKPWFDMLEENHIICTSDIYSLDPFITQMLEVQGVKAIAVFPLSQLGVHFTHTTCIKPEILKKHYMLWNPGTAGILVMTIPITFIPSGMHITVL